MVTVLLLAIAINYPLVITHGFFWEWEIGKGEAYRIVWDFYFK